MLARGPLTPTEPNTSSIRTQVLLLPPLLPLQLAVRPLCRMLCAGSPADPSFEIVTQPPFPKDFGPIDHPTLAVLFQAHCDTMEPETAQPPLPHRKVFWVCLAFWESFLVACACSRFFSAAFAGKSEKLMCTLAPSRLLLVPQLLVFQPRFALLRLLFR